MSTGKHQASIDAGIQAVAEIYMRIDPEGAEEAIVWHQQMIVVLLREEGIEVAAGCTSAPCKLGHEVHGCLVGSPVGFAISKRAQTA